MIHDHPPEREEPSPPGSPIGEGAGDDVASDDGAAPRSAKDGWILAEYRKALYQYSFIGIEFGVALLLGFLFGHWLDGHFGTSPWLMLASVLLALGVAFRDLYRLVRRMERSMRGGPR